MHPAAESSRVVATVQTTHCFPSMCLCVRGYMEGRIGYMLVLRRDRFCPRT